MGNILKRYTGTNWEAVSGAITGDTLPIGAIVAYSSNNAPTNWLICDGSAINRVTYADLFSVIGTTYGAGDGTTTFNLPNAKGKVITGLDSSQTEFNAIGKTGGEKTHQLTTAELPKHKVKLYAATTLNLASGNAVSSVANEGSSYWESELIGNDQAHNNLQPHIVQNYIIKAFQSSGVVANVVQVTTVSDTNTYSCNYVNNLNTYSTTEQRIGTYMNKPLYRKIITFNISASNTTWNIFNIINHNIQNVDLMFVNLAKSYIIRNNSQQINSGISSLISQKSSYENYAISFGANKTEISYYYGLYLVNSGDTLNFNITLEYTKTTD